MIKPEGRRIKAPPKYAVERGVHHALPRPRSQKARDRTAERRTSTSTGCSSHNMHLAKKAAVSAVSTCAAPTVLRSHPGKLLHAQYLQGVLQLKKVSSPRYQPPFWGACQDSKKECCLIQVCPASWHGYVPLHCLCSSQNSDTNQIVNKAHRVCHAIKTLSGS